MDRLSIMLDQYKGLALGLTRIATGLILFHAGYVKFFVWKLPGVIGEFERMGIFFPQAVAPFIAGLELAGGAALALGLFTRYLGVVFAIQFIVASYAVTVTVGKGFAGSRLELLMVVVCLLLATNGGGALNLGAFMKKKR